MPTGAPGELAAIDKAEILVEALPYIKRFWRKVVVVKYGGNALGAVPAALSLPAGRPRRPGRRAGRLRH